MPRDYSKTACATCKQRRKKCDEALPVCGPCSRLKLSCTYSSSREYNPRDKTRGATFLGALAVRSPLTETNALKTVTFRSDAEMTVVRNLPEVVLSFFCPTGAPSTRDLQTLWQLTLQDNLVRNALVTCFTPLVGRTSDFLRLDRTAYGQVLRNLRGALSHENLTQTGPVAVHLAVLFLGLKESIGPERLVDPLQHWAALTALIGRMTPTDIRIWSSLPLNMYLMLLESVQYHLATCAAFSKSLIPAYQVYQRSGLFEKLRSANPSGPKRIPQSPLISGQYEIYNMVLRLLILHRSAADEPVDSGELDDLELTIRFQLLTLDDGFDAAIPEGRGVQYAVSVREVYRMLCNALLITVLALREPTPPIIDEFDQIVSKTLGGFWQLPLLDMTYAISIWPLSILACGVRSDADFEHFMEQYNAFKKCLDPGHLSRSSSLIRQLRKARTLANQERGRSPERTAQTGFPIGMSLLKKRDGVLF